MEDDLLELLRSTLPGSGIDPLVVSEVRVALDRIFTLLGGNEAFRQGVVKRLQNDPRAIDGFDPVTRSIFEAILAGTLSGESVEEVVYFPQGQYQVPWLVSAVIRCYLGNIVLRTAAEAARYGQNLEIVCVGYADRSAVQKPIRFKGSSAQAPEARWVPQGCGRDDGAVFLAAPSSSSEPIGDTVRSNCELSYARAYQGILLLQGALHDDVPPDIWERISFGYQGKGVSRSGSGDHGWFDRRIEFIIRPG